MLGVVVHFEDPSTPKLELVFWRPKMLLQEIHMIFSPHDVIRLVKCTSLSTTLYCHSRTSQLGWCSASFPLLTPNPKWSLWPRMSVLVSSEHCRDLQKWRSLSPCVTKICLFLVVLEQWLSVAALPFSLYPWKPFNVDNNTLLLVSVSKFTRSFAFVLGFFAHSTKKSICISRAQKPSPSWGVW